MQETFPADVREFVAHQIASGEYRSEEDLVVDAVRQLRDSQLRLAQIRDGLKVRIERAERGETIDVEGDEALGAFLDDIEALMRRRTL